MAENLPAIEEIYRRFSAGDFEPLFDALSDDVIWRSFGPDELPWSGDYFGPGDVERFFQRVSEHVEYVAFYPVEFSEIADEIAVWGRYCLRSKKDGALLEGDWSHLLTLRKGRIAGFRENYETPRLVRCMAE